MTDEPAGGQRGLVAGMIVGSLLAALVIATLAPPFAGDRGATDPCGPPWPLRGFVLDKATGAGIAGARVTEFAPIARQDVRLDPASQLVVRVVDRNRRPVPAFRLDLGGPLPDGRRDTRTDAAGVVRFAPLWPNAKYWSLRSDVSDSRIFETQADAARIDVEVQLGDDALHAPEEATFGDVFDAYEPARIRTALLHGLVLDPDGRPLPAAWVRLNGGTGVSWISDEAVTGPDGRFEIDAATADAKVTIQARARGFAGFAEERDVAAGGEIEIRLHAARDVAGLVVVTGGAPLAKATLTLDGGPPGDARSFWAQTDSSGTFRFRSVASGTWRLSVEPDEDGADARPVSMTVEAGSTALRIVAGAGLVIAGTLVDDAGQPVADQGIEARRLDGGAGADTAAVTDDNGRFELRHLAPGPHALALRHLDVEFGSFEAGSAVALRLPGRETITGRARAADGSGRHPDLWML